MNVSLVPSPCVDVCTIDPESGWCRGCLRTLDEIAAWGGLDDPGRRAIWKRLPERRARVAARQAPPETAP
ncbi:MAG: DUF1289 domain-containing protein [Caldimonas sp.]